MSKSSNRKFNREREAHYRREAEVEFLARQARLRGFRVAKTMSEAILGVRPEAEAEAVARGLNRAQRRMRGIR